MRRAVNVTCPRQQAEHAGLTAGPQGSFVQSLTIGQHRESTQSPGKHGTSSLPAQQRPPDIQNILLNPLSPGKCGTSSWPAQQTQPDIQSILLCWNPLCLQLSVELLPGLLNKHNWSVKAIFFFAFLFNVEEPASKGW